MMSRFGRALICTLFVALVSCTSAWAQATAAISGTVRDQSGGVLPGVTVTATQQDTGIVRTTVSNETGSFSLLSLPLGPYGVEMELAGFGKFVQRGIVLQVGANAVVNAVLTVGELSAEVQVTAAAPVVDTRTVGVSTVVESERIVELPLNARQVTQLITLSGVAVQTTVAGSFAMQTGARIAVAGGSDNGVSYYLDGAPHINTLDGTGLHLPFPDALQEFRLTTGSQDPGANIRAAASVAAVTKSGTNLLHGDAFEFLRDAKFNSPDPFSGKTDALKRNQFGGTLGGPIVKDKLFFFAGVQATRTRQNPINQTSFVPTAAMRAGDFTAFASPTCNNGRQLTLGGGFVNNTIDPSLLSPAALNIAARLPTPSDECGKVLWGEPNNRNEYQVPVRLDYQPNSAHGFVMRYMLTTDDRSVPFEDSGRNLLATFFGGADDHAHSLTGGHTWVINSSMVNSLRVFGNTIDTNKVAAEFFSPQDVGINAYTYLPKLTFVSVQGNFIIGQGAFNMGSYSKLRSGGVSNHFTVVKGAHQFNVGGTYLRNTSEAYLISFGAGNYIFNGTVTSNAMSDFMLGRVSQLRAATPSLTQIRQPIASLFASDSWKVKNLTLNYGLVWNPFLPPTFFDGSGYTFDRTAAVAGTRSTVRPYAPPGFAYPGDPGFSGSSGVKRHLNGWDPRVGFAWDITGDGRTALRGGAGVSHEYMSHTTYLNNSNVSPNGLILSLGAGTSLDNPWAAYPGGNPFPYTFNPNNTAAAFPAYTSFLPFPPDLEPTRQYSWNIGVQREITSRWSAAATYIGNRLVNTQVAIEQNPGLNLGFGPCTLYDATIGGPRAYPVCTVAANVNQRRALNLNPVNPLIPNTTGSALGYITQYTDEGYQRYHGMLLSTRLDIANFWNLNANHTVSSCVGLLQPVTLNLGASLMHTPFANNDAFAGDLSRDEGPCVGDRRHLSNLTSVLRSPNLSGGFLAKLVSNWSASSVIQVRSGAPINVTGGTDAALNGVTDSAATQRPNVVPGVDPYGDTSSLTNYLNLSAFSQPAAGTYGNSGFNSLVGPGFWQWDQSFVRGFGLSDGHRIEVRVEAINVTNRANYANPGSAINNQGTYGRITSVVGTPRVWQFALKYTF